MQHVICVFTLFLTTLCMANTHNEQLAASVDAFVSLAPKAFNDAAFWQTLCELLEQGATFADAGVDINTLHPTGVTLLHCAVKNDNKPLVVALLKQDAQPDIQDAVLFNTPLHIAAKQGNSTMIILLQRGQAHLNIQNSEGATPLHLAVMHHHTNAAHLLLTFGAQQHLRDRYGHTAYDYAQAREYQDILVLFKSHSFYLD